MAEKRRFLDVWIVDSNTVYREVPFTVVADWVQQGRLLEDDNHLSVFRSPSFNSNGNPCDPQGRLLTCVHSGRRVTRTELTRQGIESIVRDHDGTPGSCADP